MHRYFVATKVSSICRRIALYHAEPAERVIDRLFIRQPINCLALQAIVIQCICLVSSILKFFFNQLSQLFYQLYDKDMEVLSVPNI